MTTKKIIFLKLIVLLAAFPFFGLQCAVGGGGDVDNLKPVTLEYWRVFDEPSDFSEIVQNFRASYPHINVKVKKLRFNEFETELIRALAEGRGPDIISLHNTWLKQYQNLISPMPASVKLPTVVKEGPKLRVINKETPLLTLNNLRNNFVDVVQDDAVIDGQIYGLPLSLDTLVLFYNRKMLDNANIPNPPATWDDFKDQIKKLTLQNREGEIIQAGAAIGTSANINRSPDILAVLMMQNGTEMMNINNTRAAFNQIPGTMAKKQIAPGRDALRFYTDFASPAKEVYTWNESLPESMDAFTSQKTAFFFGYAYHLPLIRTLSPNLDFGIVPLPQITGTTRPVNFANYWLETVSKSSLHQNEAWAFINFATAENNVPSFLNRAQKPTALRTLISAQRANEELVHFVDQVLSARSWYHGRDAAKMEEAFRTMIDDVLTGKRTPDEAISVAAEKVNQTL